MMNTLKLSRTLGRCYYSTIISPETSRKSSLPIQVALRRSKNPPLEPDQNLERYNSLLSLNKLPIQDGQPLPYEEWLEKITSRRTRIRGTRLRVNEELQEAMTEVVGKRIYLPNIVFRLMRNYTPPGEAYNPYEATFRIPRSVTKNDVRSYLSAVYGIECTYIRTDNYIAPMEKRVKDGQTVIWERRGGTETTYKRAVVGLTEPFAYPNAVEDMTEEERKEHGEWMERMFQTDTVEKFRKEKKMDEKTGRPERKMLTNRGHVLKLVMQKRKEREEAIDTAVKEFVASGASPFEHPPSVAQ